VLALRGRVAWAHDWVSDPTLAASVNRGNRIANEPHIILAISAHRITHPTLVSRGFPLLMSNHRLASFARRDGRDTERQGESRPVLKSGRFHGSKSGHIMIEDAQEERFSDVVATAYFALALLLMILWAYVPA
jgi:hypothetical protein